MEKEAERSRGAGGLPKFTHLVAEPTLASKSPDFKFKAFLLYPFIQITKQNNTNQRSQIQKTTDCMIPLISNF